MDASQICLFLVALCGSFFVASVVDCAIAATRIKCVTACILLICVAAISYVGQLLLGGESLDRFLMHTLLERNPKLLSTLAGGGIAGFGCGIVIAIAQRGEWKLTMSMVGLSVVCAVVSLGLVIAWDSVFDIERFKPRVLDDAYDIELLAKTENSPIRLALDEIKDLLFVSTYTTAVNGQYSGSIFSLPTTTTDKVIVTPTLAAHSPVLYRPFGLACYQGDLFVSRAGHAANTNNGNIEYLDQGAVTQLKDLDSDGSFEYFHDVLTGIPAARGPDTMHQNNGIVFDGEGNLFVAVGSNDDRTLDQHRWSGTVLKLAIGQHQPEVFARGLRNPFGICCGPGGALFVTDNDCAEDPGDEVDFVIEGDHLGHPYSIPGESKVIGLTAPLLVGDRSNFCGVACTSAHGLTESRKTVYVCDMSRNTVLRLDTSVQDGRCTILEKSDFAYIDSPVDVVVNEEGDLFVASYHKRKIYRIHRR